MTRRLARFVYVADAAGRTHGFGPGDTVPAWAAQRITNPAAWADPPVADDPPSAFPAGRSAQQVAAGPPPRAGAGSGRAAWAAFAAGKVDVTDDMRRDDIVAALQAAGHLDD